MIWFDATLTLFRRYRDGEKLSQAHRKHVYQRAVQSGLSHDKVVIYSALINILVFSLIYFTSNLFYSFIATIIFLYIIVKLVDNKKPFI